MRRLLPIIFGISTALSPLCTMAFAQGGHGVPMTHAAACDAAGQHGTTGMCGEKGADAPVAFHAQTPCADGACFLRSAAQENSALSPNILSLLGTASPPPALDAQVSRGFAMAPIGTRTADWPPPDILSGVVLRE
ncbi:MAG: hypothetical protein AAB728_04160 [Patescibacteria group bacterium]